MILVCQYMAQGFLHFKFFELPVFHDMEIHEATNETGLTNLREMR